MSAISQSVHDATVALRDAADMATSLSRAASALSDAFKSVADLEARVAALEHTVFSPRAVAAQEGKKCADSEAMMHAKMHSHVDTKTAAVLLCRSPQTLRKWACYEDGPLRPARVNGRLAWPVAEIRHLLNDD